MPGLSQQAPQHLGREVIDPLEVLDDHHGRGPKLCQSRRPLPDQSIDIATLGGLAVPQHRKPRSPGLVPVGLVQHDRKPHSL